MKRKNFYYVNELEDDFAGIKRKPYIIDKNYSYIRVGFLWRLCEIIVYRIIMMPFAYIYIKVKFRHKVVNKNLLKQAKKQGYFLYGNHTLIFGDALIPNLINTAKRTYTIVHSDNISKILTRKFIEMCGAIPLPNTISATKNFVDVIAKRVEKGCAIMIYPEAHIWPYYVGIRDFKSGSFKYPLKFGVPAYSITNTFHKRRFTKVPRIITYIDGPFFVEGDLPNKVKEANLKNMVYKCMCDRASLSTYSVHTYTKLGGEL